MRMMTILLLGLWLFLIGLVLVILPRPPNSAFEWLLLVVFGPPAYIIVSTIFEWLGGKRPFKRLLQSQLFGVRVVVILGIVFYLAVLGWGLWLLQVLLHH
jgi:O-antigen/teichoic acid export membrane protein